MMMKLTWRAEYVLAILQAEGECKTQYLREIGSSFNIIDTLNTLEERGLIKVRRPNGKLRMHSLTDLAREYLQQVEDIYVKS
jgi:DNA-binding PadR family transcriptional regulator